MKSLHISLLLCLMTRVVYTENSTDSLKQLYTTLLVDYDTRLRPIHDQHGTLTINAYFVPVLVLELDTELQRLTFSAHFMFSWTDEYLTWNLTDSDGISHMYFPVNQIWHPAFILSMAYDGRLNVGHSDDVVSVTSGGVVSWSTEGVFKVLCEVDIEFYPFDTQVCPMYLYINDFSRLEALLLPNDGGSQGSALTENPVWHTLDITSESKYKGGAQMIQYKFRFRRRAAFIMYTTIGPLIILAFLNATAFLVPIESGEKGSIVITILLSFCVYMSSTATLLPPNSIQNSNLLIYMTILEATSAFTVFYTMLQSCLHANTGCFPKLSDLFKDLKRTSSPKGSEVGPVVDDKSTLKEDDLVTEEPNGATRSKYWAIDVVMFSVFLIINVVVLSVFASKVQSSFEDAETR